MELIFAPPHQIGRALRRWRKQQAVPAQRLAWILGCSLQQIYAIERGEKPLRLSDLQRLDHLFHTHGYFLRAAVLAVRHTVRPHQAA